jgi:hypothetical protein
LEDFPLFFLSYSLFLFLLFFAATTAGEPVVEEVGQLGRGLPADETLKKYKK